MDNFLEEELGFQPKIHPIFEKIDDEQILSPEEISEMLKMSKESVRRWCRQGKLPNYNFGGKYVIIGKDFKDFMKSAKSRGRMGTRLAN